MITGKQKICNFFLDYSVFKEIGKLDISQHLNFAAEIFAKNAYFLRCGNTLNNFLDIAESGAQTKIKVISRSDTAFSSRTLL